MMFRTAMNEVLRRSYIEDCQRCLARWNRVIEEFEIPYRLRLPDRKFHRHIGMYSEGHFDPAGRPLSDEQWQARRDEFLPGERDRQVIAASLKDWDSKGTSAWCGYSFSWMACLRARVGDELVIHFRNMDTLRRQPHSMHFHGVHYRPGSDGAYLPGFSGPGADVKPGKEFTYLEP